MIDVGRAATFTCSITGYPINSVTWFKDGLPLVIGDNRKLEAPRILRINSVGKEDKGMYQCFVHNSEDEAQGNAELKLGGRFIMNLDFVFT